tara:strand:- start:1597 stop:1899 length:303 start_codon:yes stop_codon:yes gene_type:complete
MAKKINRTNSKRFGIKNTGAIYERNPDTGEIRSRQAGRSESNYNFPTREKITTSAQLAMSRSEILDEIWAAEKHTHDGEWFVRLSDVCAILGEDYARKDK